MQKFITTLIFFLSFITSPIVCLADNHSFNTNEATLSQISNNFGEIKNGALYVTATHAATILNKYPSIKILDVRTAWEFDRGHLQDAININYYWFGFEKKLNTLDKNTTWLIHCKSGVRSSRTIKKMIKAGFKSLIHLDGGIDAWKDKNLPVIISKK